MSDEVKLKYEYFWYKEQVEAYLRLSAGASVSAVASSTCLSAASGSSGALLPSTSAAAVAAAAFSSSSAPGVSSSVAPLAAVASFPAEGVTHLLRATSATSSCSRLAPEARPGLNRPDRPSSAPPPASAVREHWLDSSLADSALRRYRKSWEDWCRYAASHRVSALPPDTFALELYVCEVAEESKSVSKMEMIRAAVNHFCFRDRFESPFSSP
jgi:hypothetical protein